MMVKTPNPQCFTENGKLGFYATGRVKLLCSVDTCGPRGKAEIWCQDCCDLRSTPSVVPAAKSSSSSFRPVIIVSVTLGCSLLALILIRLVYVLSLKFVSRRSSYHDYEAGLVEDGSLVLTQQLCDGRQNDRQQFFQPNTSPERTELVMPGTSVIRPISDGDQLPFSQQPSNNDEDSGQKSSQIVEDTAPEKAELVVPGQRVVRSLSCGS